MYAFQLELVEPVRKVGKWEGWSTSWFVLVVVALHVVAWSRERERERVAWSCVWEREREAAGGWRPGGFPGEDKALIFIF
jgi:hypothetical protein